jgi:hypothetical protein
VTVEGGYVASWDALNKRKEDSIRTCYGCTPTESASNRIVGLDALSRLNEAMYREMMPQTEQ